MSNVEKVVLVNPPVYSTIGIRDMTPYPPLGLAYLAAALEESGIEVKVIDCFLDGEDIALAVSDTVERVGLADNEIVKRIEEENPDLVGVSSQFSRNYSLARKILTKIKSLDAEIITVIGGAHVTAVPGDARSISYIDFVVEGEGEQAIESLAKTGALVPRKGFIEDLDTLPMPSWHTSNLTKYFGSRMSHGYRKHKEFAPVQTSRGCPAKCSFCTAYKVWGRKFRARSAESIIFELQKLKYTFGVKEIMFEDDNLTVDKSRAMRLFKMMVKMNINLVWDTPNGIAAWTLSHELISVMKESGCYKLNFALESGSQRVLNEIIKKPVNLKHAKEMVKFARSIGLDVGLFLVVGMPGETFADIDKSFELADDLGIYFPHVSFATPYPGSKLYKECMGSGYLPADYSFEDMHIRKFSISTPEWSAQQLKDYVNRKIYKLRMRSLLKDPIGLSTRVVRRLLC